MGNRRRWRWVWANRKLLAPGAKEKEEEEEEMRRSKENPFGRKVYRYTRYKVQSKEL